MEEHAVTACWRRLEIDSNGSAHESGVNKTPILGRCQVITITRSVYHNPVNIIELCDAADGGLFVIILTVFSRVCLNIQTEPYLTTSLISMFGLEEQIHHQKSLG